MFRNMLNLFRRPPPPAPPPAPSPYESFIDFACHRSGKTREELFAEWGGDETMAKQWLGALEGAGVDRVKHALDTQPGSHIRI